MSWLQKLHETYDYCGKSPGFVGSLPWPVAHIVKRAHVEVALDSDGAFRRARTLERAEGPTLIPATESSAGRTSKPVPHPLCEELSYCAADLPDSNAERHQLFIAQLKAWCSSPFSHPKARAILKYIRAGTLWSDLDRAQLFPITVQNKQGTKAKVADEKVFVRWRVECVGDPCSGTWEDPALIDSWKAFDASQNSLTGFCMTTGEYSRIGQSHPRFVRNSGDGGKLISANDSDGYTFRGRFTDGKSDYGKQVCTVGFEASQKAHSALRWLISRQGYRNDDQVIVSWAIAGVPVPDPFASTFELFGASIGVADTGLPAGDTSEAFALRLKSAIAGYRANLNPTDEVVVMGLDSATPGRMAITYYRELKGSEFLERIETWHSKCAWPQNFGKAGKFVGAPSPRDIAETAYGRRLDDKLSKATVERLLPCIVDGLPLPRDLIESTKRRTTNRVGLEHWEWEKCLGVACALFKAYYPERSYQMALELDRTSRDYLYGRLLAIAEHIESRALYIAGEKRDTTAARLMQRFADRPSSTWRTIELSLKPYVTRLRNLRPGTLYIMEKLLDDVITAFKDDSFTNDAALSGEFLLGYHCQRQALRPVDAVAEEDQPTPTIKG